MKVKIAWPGVVALILVLAGALFLATWQSRHHLGQPGVRVVDEVILGIDDTGGLLGSTNTFVAGTNSIYLPEQVANFDSIRQPVSKVVLDWLPADTTYGQRIYTGKDGFRIQANAVLMGTDRTSIHKPEFCLPMQGWQVTAKKLTAIPVNKPRPYELPVMRMDSRQSVKGADGKEQVVASVFVYWFVADKQLTARHGERMWWMARDLLRSGVLQRWAYVTYFSICQPGQEDATYARMRQFITEAVPEFQLTPAPAREVAAAAIK
jgi:hypothetical protein